MFVSKGILMKFPLHFNIWCSNGPNIRETVSILRIEFDCVKNGFVVATKLASISNDSYLFYKYA